MTNMAIAFAGAIPRRKDEYELWRKRIVATAKRLTATSTIFTKFGRREAADMSLRDIEENFGTQAAWFVHHLRNGNLKVRKAS